MGGAQPLAVTMAGGVAICVEVDPSRIARRLAPRLPRRRGRRHRRRAAARGRGARRAPAALDRPARQRRRRLPGAARARRADRRRDRPDLRPRPARLPARGRRLRGLARRSRERDPGTSRRARASRWPATSRRWSASRTRAPRSSTTATRSAPRRGSAATSRAFDFPGFVPAYIRPLFCEGRGPFRWAALSGDPADIAATDQAVLDLFPEQRVASRAGSSWPAEKVRFQGLPARICWLGHGERHLAGLRVQRPGRAAARSRRRS